MIFRYSNEIRKSKKPDKKYKKNSVQIECIL